MEEVKAESLTLRDDNGQWLGQVVITSDGMYASVTDWGNFSYAWRSYGNDFKKFLCGLNESYFAQKMENGMSYQAKMNKGACQRYAEKILPALQKELSKQNVMIGGL